MHLVGFHVTSDNIFSILDSFWLFQRRWQVKHSHVKMEQQKYTLHSKYCQDIADILHELLIYVGKTVRSNSLKVMTHTFGITWGNSVILNKVIFGFFKWPRGTEAA